MKEIMKKVSVSAVWMILMAQPVLAQESTTPTKDGDEYVQQLDRMINIFVKWAAILAGVIALAYLIMAGIKYVTSSGDPAKTEEAQKQIVSAIIGLAIVILSYTLLRVVLYLFGVNEFGFEGMGRLNEDGESFLPGQTTTE